MKITAAFATAGCLAVTVATALAEAIPSATYNGVTEDGAGLSFTISPDGTLVSSFKITGAHGDTCMFNAEFDTGAWPGAPITNNTFDYQVGNGVLFKGTFTGPQSASGTYRLSHPSSGGAAGACDTGVVGWTATTNAKPPPRGGGGSEGSGSGGNGSGNGSGEGGGGRASGGRSKKVFATYVVLHKLPRERLGGRLSSASAACKAGRTVILWRGTHRFTRTKTKANGTFWFMSSKTMRGRSVRASVLVRSTATAVCAAGSSTFIRG